MKKILEIWADSFHEGTWCCENIMNVAKSRGYITQLSFIRGFQPQYLIRKDEDELVLIVYGSYGSWSPLPQLIQKLIEWGKPDFVAYDATAKQILFAVEETAATPTGNQAMQRCERQYGSARFGIPYWYLISEFGVHRDGGLRRDSIWPTIAAIKLSIRHKIPCVVLHYSDIDNPEDYASGTGVDLLFNALFNIFENHVSGREKLHGLKPLLSGQYAEMLNFVQSQWRNIIDFLPSEKLILNPDTAEIIAEIAVGDTTNEQQISGLLEWPTTKGVPVSVRAKWRKKELLKFDPLCAQMEQDIEDGKAYYLSNNAGSGRPPTTAQIKGWIGQQEQLFERSGFLTPPAVFSLKIDDFPDTGSGNDRRHLTTAKNIVYLYDSWNIYVDSIVGIYPRLQPHLHKLQKDVPVFVYVSNSIKPGRLFGDPFTGQLAAYSTAFGKFDSPPRMVVAYFPHQVHTQAILNGEFRVNKGMTLLAELTNYIIFHAGVAVDLSKKEVL